MKADAPTTESRPTSEPHKVPDDTVLVIGGGPVGLMVASVLAYFGVRSIVLERNAEPTR
jgi:FAD-dependent monooxygenase